MEAKIKITCPPMLDYLLQCPPSIDDYDALPLFLMAEPFSSDLALLTAGGRLYADSSQLDQFKAARVFGAFDLEGGGIGEVARQLKA